jgi:hypothetical protein
VGAVVPWCWEEEEEEEEEKESTAKKPGPKAFVAGF